MAEGTITGAQRIGDEDWHALKDIIVSHYRKSTLEETMEYMSKEHNFHPTRRQYVHRLGKIWKVSKYKKPTLSSELQNTSDQVSRLPATKATMMKRWIRDASTMSPQKQGDDKMDLHRDNNAVRDIMIPDDHRLDEIFQPFHARGNLSAATPPPPPATDSDSDSALIARDRKQVHQSGKPEALISCPFRKRNPHRFNIRDHPSCAAYGFSNLTVLKNHVVRTHSQEFLCQRCRVLLPNREALEAHAQLPPEQMCQVPSGPRVNNFEDGVTIERAWRLSSPFASSSVTTWQGLWQVLFPGDGDIPSPDYSPVVESFEVQNSSVIQIEEDAEALLLAIKDRVENVPADANKAQVMARVEEAILGFRRPGSTTGRDVGSSKTDILTTATVSLDQPRGSPKRAARVDSVIDEED
ncbi:hypothetical protein B0T21DRAFT_366978 [Apiosordaria backusii]|uniref:Clr5 domain-containing protein n=1 Tax=Apiosordaria backusii TaxID=314023 RepID=A0AA40BLI3_9PEZI|nr:hypothetical protein B0T21DRAFT_366978 [Apiosordaria backusii]